MKHFVFSPLAALVFCTSSLYAQPLPLKYDTRGHQKAKGVWMTVRYPQSFDAKEGERPNIVQKFIGMHAGIFTQLMIQVKAADGDIEKECSEMKSAEWVDALSDSGVSITNVKIIRHENKPGAILDMNHSGDRAGIIIHSKYRIMAVCHKRNLIAAWCGVSEQSNLAARNNLIALAPLCHQYFNSLVLMDHY